MNSEKKSGNIYVLLSAIFFALGGILIKSNSWSSMTINGLRGFVAFFMLYADMKLAGHKFRINKAVIFGAIANFGMSTLFVMANKLTSAANAIVLQFTMPLFLILLLWMFWKQKPDKTSLITVMVSFVGIIFFFVGRLTPAGMLGNILAIASGLLYAVVFLLKKIPDSDFESSILISFAISFVVGIPFFASEAGYPAGNFINILVLGIFQVGCAYICLNKGLNRVTPVAAALISMIEPVLNPILAAIFLCERIGMTEIIGAVIVLLSATVYNLLLIKKKQPEE